MYYQVLTSKPILHFNEVKIANLAGTEVACGSWAEIHEKGIISTAIYNTELTNSVILLQNKERW